MDKEIAITFACGHTVLAKPYFKTKAHEMVCRDCWRRKQYERTRAKSRAAGLPKLQGSEKQVQWAEVIRWGVFEQAQNLDMLVPPDIAAAAREHLARVLTFTESAKWWIENRENVVSDVIKMLLKKPTEAQPTDEEELPW